MTDALFNVQTAVTAALATSSELQGLVGNPPRFYDHVPPGAVFPFVALGPLHVAPYDAKVETGFEQIITLDIFSRYRGSRECKDIFAALYDALHRAVLSVSGEVFLSCEFHSADFALENDGLTYRGAIRFSIVTQGS